MDNGNDFVAKRLEAIDQQAAAARNTGFFSLTSNVDVQQFIRDAVRVLKARPVAERYEERAQWDLDSAILVENFNNQVVQAGRPPILGDEVLKDLRSRCDPAGVAAAIQAKSDELDAQMQRSREADHVRLQNFIERQNNKRFCTSVLWLIGKCFK